MDGITEGVTSMFSTILSRIKEEIQVKLNSHNISLTNDQMSIIEAVFKDGQDPFVDLRSRHLQEKYIKENLDLLVSPRGGIH